MISSDNEGDYIAQVVVWRDSNGICALQFYTLNGRVSKCYGGNGGKPVALDGATGHLMGFLAKGKEGIIYELQGHWCEDIQHARVGAHWKCSRYYGRDEGDRFDDSALLGQSKITYITSVKIRGGQYDIIDGIQTTYSLHENGCTTELRGLYHGGSGNQEKDFSLRPGERITSVGGKAPNRIKQLWLTTNYERIFVVSGRNDGGDGGEFLCTAPPGTNGRSMHLHSIIGKCGSFLYGVMLVWTAD